MYLSGCITHGHSIMAGLGAITCTHTDTHARISAGIAGHLKAAWSHRAGRCWIINLTACQSSHISSTSIQHQWQAASLTPLRTAGCLHSDRTGRSLQLGGRDDGLPCRWPKFETCVLHPESRDPPRTHAGLKPPSSTGLLSLLLFMLLF